MKWLEIRAQYPEQWLLIEAIKARSENNKRIIDEIEVLESFSDSAGAMGRYSQMRRKSPKRELYVFHTSRETLEVTERRWMGIQVSQ
ncbi:conserved hypothetical protein [Candidatus Desulfarcum epimagneticum]|uniref:Uncharacterized protein n=1 Tax=uncultured Desulfobacteraceae bacterium TaxID=218296 RepID=A0A484HFQ4_9BACT|nr:conserved hypothetical protein [uncultured Desulfobacteraceae bacterium]